MLLFLNATLLGYRIFHHVFFSSWVPRRRCDAVPKIIITWCTCTCGKLLAIRWWKTSKPLAPTMRPDHQHPPFFLQKMVGPPASTSFFLSYGFSMGKRRDRLPGCEIPMFFLGGGFLWGWLQLVWKHQPGAAAVGPGASVGTLLWGQNPWHTGWIDDPTMMFRLLVKCVWYHW